MDIAYEIAKWIENLDYTLGTDLFVGMLPVGTEKGVFVIRSGGTMNNYIPVTQSVLDIYYKDTSAKTAISKLEEIKRAMHRMIDTQTNSAQIYSMLVIGDIDDVARDRESGKIYKFTVAILHRDKATIS